VVREARDADDAAYGVQRERAVFARCGSGRASLRQAPARDPAGVNVAAFTPAVFGQAKPRDLETWNCTATRAVAELVKRDYFGREAHAFARAAFLVGRSLPASAL